MGPQGMPGYPGPPGLSVCKYVIFEKQNKQQNGVFSHKTLAFLLLAFVWDKSSRFFFQGPNGRSGRRGRRGSRGKPVGGTLTKTLIL